MHLEDGEALGIIGPNGAGKSTLFNLITGSLTSDTGTITFDGQDMTGLPAYARCRAGIGRSYQIPHPFGGMTVFENLLVGAAFGGGEHEAESYEHCAEILERTRGNVAWAAFYGLFVLAAAVHAPIGLRNLAREWLSWRGASLDLAVVLFGLVLFGLGLRAVWAVIGGGS